MARSLAEYQACLFDVDGARVRPDKAIPGAADALAVHKAHGKAARAVTNNSALSRHAIAERFRCFGLPLDDHEAFRTRAGASPATGLPPVTT